MSDATADPAILTALLVGQIAATNAAASEYERAVAEAARNPAFLDALKVAYTIAKGIAPVAAGVAGGPAVGAVVAAGVRILDAADGPGL